LELWNTNDYTGGSSSTNALAMKSGKLTAAEFKQLFPNASVSAYKANRFEAKEATATQCASEEATKLMREAIAKGIRPGGDEAKLNELEKRYLRFLEGQQPAWIGIQCITLKLAEKLNYTPDFWAIDNDGIRAIDTKGKHIWEDAIVKMKIAARLFPWVRIIMAQENGLVWNHREVAP